MPNFTVQELVERAASEADMTDNFVTPVEWLRWFNSERRALSLHAARSGWVLTGVALTDVDMATNGSATYTHPTEFLAVVGVSELERPSWRLRPLEIDTFVDMNFQDSLGPITGPARKVSVVDGGDGTTQFRFFPRPTSGLYRLFLVPAPVAATALTDSAYFPMGTEERVVLGMARRAKRKEESDVSDLDRAIQEEDRRVSEVAWSRTIAQVPRVRNVDRDARGWVNEFLFPAPDAWLWM